MAARRSNRVDARVRAQVNRMAAALIPREWVVAGWVSPEIRGRPRYQRTVWAQSALAAVEEVVVACRATTPATAFCLHSVMPAATKGGWNTPRNAMGPL